MAQVWGSHLSVFPVSGAIPLSSQDCFGLYSPYFSSNSFGSSVGVNNADLAIYVGAEDVVPTPAGDIDLCPAGTLAIALTCSIDQFDRPIMGAINFCLNNIVRRLEEENEDNRKLDSSSLRAQMSSSTVNILGNDAIADATLVAIHEAGHALGFSLPLMQYFRDAETGEPLTPRPFTPTNVQCDDGTIQNLIFPSTSTVQARQTSDGRVYHEVVTPRVTQVVRNHFNCQSLTGARLENRPTNTAMNCTGQHWDERLFQSELMGPIFSGYTDALSPLTLALMEDSGWYKVTYENAELSPFGHGLGCDFVNEPCIVNDQVPEYGRDAFCDVPTTFSSTGDLETDVVTCDPTHKSFAVCDLVDISTAPFQIAQSIPADATRYFSDPNLVGLNPQADFCPMAIVDARLDCTNDLDNSNIQTYQGESRGPSSRCINGGVGSTTFPGCFEITCDAQQHKVIVAGQTCDFEGQLLSIRTADTGQQATLECPRLGSICPQLFCPGECSGRGVCDYDALPPRCNCFDSTDTSAACSKGLPPAQPTWAPIPSPGTDGSSSSVVGGTIALGVIMIATFLVML